jgi:hypothetical protein
VQELPVAPVDAPTASATALMEPAIVQELLVAPVDAPTANATALTEPAIVRPKVRPDAIVVARPVRACVAGPLNRHPRARSVVVGPGAAHVPPESPVAVVAPTVTTE